MAYVSVEHQPGVWVDAHIEKQWKRDGRWRLACYYFVDSVQFYRVFDAGQVRPASSAEGQEAELRHTGARPCREDDAAGQLTSVALHEI